MEQEVSREFAQMLFLYAVGCDFPFILHRETIQIIHALKCIFSIMWNKGFLIDKQNYP